MDQQLRRCERSAEAGDPEAIRRCEALLRRCGVERTEVPVETRIRLGMFDQFVTQLREDIIEEAVRIAEEGERFVDGVNLDPPWWPVDLWVNGRRLMEVVNGDYSPHLPAHAVYLPTRYLLGEPYAGPAGWSQLFEEDGKSLLLFCHCGDEGCGRLVARITASRHAVIWSELEHRPCCGKPVPDVVFVFQRQQYEDALRDPKPWNKEPGWPNRICA